MPLRKAAKQIGRKTAYRLLRGSMGGPFFTHPHPYDKSGAAVNPRNNLGLALSSLATKTTTGCLGSLTETEVPCRKVSWWPRVHENNLTK